MVNRWLLMLMLATVSCASVPVPDRIGQEILIAEQVMPRAATVNVLDEVRWVNRREGTIRLLLLDGDEASLTCQRGFGSAVIAATLQPEESASVCFARPGTFRYTVRLDRALPDGRINVLGIIEVAGRDSRHAGAGKRVGPADPIAPQ